MYVQQLRLILNRSAELEGAPEKASDVVGSRPLLRTVEFLQFLRADISVPIGSSMSAPAI